MGEGAWLVDRIRDVPDFPRPGVIFKDLAPVMADAALFGRTVDGLAALAGQLDPQLVLGVEARGFIFGAPVAQRLGLGFVPVRKPGKLPAATISQEFDLEYGTDALELQTDALGDHRRVVVVDDVLATGGTVGAVAALVSRLGADVVGVAVVLELAFLGARQRLGELPVHSLATVGG